LDGELGWLAALDSDLDLVDAGETEWERLTVNVS
jgi:hypothetical protein